MKNQSLSLHLCRNLACSRWITALLLAMLSALLLWPSRVDAAASPAVLYSQGSPSNDEQYILELINRARANPAAEGNRLASIQVPSILQEFTFFSVNTITLRSNFAGYSAKPPLALNTKLSAAAHRLGQDEATRGFQSHTGSDGSTTASRLKAAGYAFLAYGENTYVTAETPFFSHAAFNVDWGVPDLFHRKLIMNTEPTLPTFREIGLSCLPATAAHYGPLVVTHEFGLASITPLATGVAYKDNDSDGFYTPGEGVANIRVSSFQSSYYALTSASGGYSLPLDKVSVTHAVQIVFQDSSGTQTVRNVTLPALPLVGPDTVFGPTLANIKVDDVIGASPASISITKAKKAVRLTGKAGKFTLERSGGNLGEALQIHYAASGSAVSGRDYQPVSGVAVFAAGATTSVVKIRPIPDLDPPATAPTVVLTIKAGSGYQPSKTAATSAQLIIQ